MQASRHDALTDHHLYACHNGFLEPDPSIITASQPSTQNPPSAPALKKKKKVLNMNTYKYHSLGDYIQFIRLFGPTDSYSTQLGESLHRLLKRLFELTNKRYFAAQIGLRLMRIKRRRAARERIVIRRKHFHHVGFHQDDPMGATPSTVHHHTNCGATLPCRRYQFTRRPDPATLSISWDDYSTGISMATLTRPSPKMTWPQCVFSTIKSTPPKHCASTTQHMTFGETRTHLILELEHLLRSTPLRQHLELTHIGTVSFSVFFMRGFIVSWMGRQRSLKR
ncbi:hypothetical protein B0H14DRAFT_1199605 [Mycena olivaceomarginata]|nr:hypothetical protein B0H14DRAFT_1199605 [Mycena olivaceomarginata]